ncbi:uncharacterized protein LOC129350112 [Amphiprion ocellaris]|uniref:uncharacterized protein LOC129350112 n=1 Tax=Amphiprion ocellaris TaxID=80972 RepID=UPI0024110F15|nr:uncharacterized protein LOC129350112 [Amphiprion ocellaris]
MIFTLCLLLIYKTMTHYNFRLSCCQAHLPGPCICPHLTSLYSPCLSFFCFSPIPPLHSPSLYASLSLPFCVCLAPLCCFLQRLQHISRRLISRTPGSCGAAHLSSPPLQKKAGSPLHTLPDCSFSSDITRWPAVPGAASLPCFASGPPALPRITLTPLSGFPPTLSSHHLSDSPRPAFGFHPASLSGQAPPGHSPDHHSHSLHPPTPPVLCC